jgi:hypothetical protein
VGALWRCERFQHKNGIDRKEDTIGKLTLERSDDEGGSRRYDRDLGLTVLDCELYGYAQTLPSGGRFCDIFSDLLRGLEGKYKRKR